VTEVWCVLRSGGDFTPQHVARLSAQIETHAGVKLHCLTDMPSVVADVANSVIAEPMHFNWPSWWAKIELYLHPGPILYLDLDVTVIGDLRPLMDLATKHNMVMCRGFWGDADPNPLNSTVVGWRGDQTAIPRAFLRDVPGHIERGGQRDAWGDQGFVRSLLGADAVSLWQEEIPGAVRSYKREAFPSKVLPTAIVASHGKPRPWDRGGADEWLRAKGVRV